MQILGKQRSADLDFLRVIATLAVIIIHCSALLVLFRPVGSASWMLGNFLDSFVRWSVPVFVMISGALLINDKAFKDPKRFFTRRFARILAPLLAWPIIYAIWLTATGTPFKLENFWFEFLAGNPQPGHLYFLFLIAGLYALTPLISLVAANFNRRQLWTITWIILLATFVWHATETFVLRGGPPVNLLTQGLPYVGYYLLGYLLLSSTYAFTLRQAGAAFVGGGVTIALITWLMFPALGAEKGLYFYNFPTPFVALTAAGAFVGSRLLYKMAMDKLDKKTRSSIEQWLTAIALNTFGVYLIHVLVLNSIAHYLPWGGKTVWGVALLIPATALISYGLVVVLRKVPGFKYLLP